MYFDSHAHLNDERFQKDFEEILARMKHSGVTAMMNIGCDLPSSTRTFRGKKFLKFFANYPNE